MPPEGTVTSETYAPKEKREDLLRYPEKKESRAKTHITVRLPEVYVEELEAEAKRRGVPRSKLIEDAIKKLLIEIAQEEAKLKEKVSGAFSKEQRELLDEKWRQERWRKILTDYDNADAYGWTPAE